LLLGRVILGLRADLLGAGIKRRRPGCAGGRRN
jgi:hypothetical protein